MDDASREKIKSIYYFMDYIKPEQSDSIDILDILYDMSVYISDLEQRIKELEMSDNE